MSDAAPQTRQERFADLATLHKQLEELAARTMRPSGTEREQPQGLQGPVLLIRGK
jgi:hypothetical protein